MIRHFTITFVGSGCLINRESARGEKQSMQVLGNKRAGDLPMSEIDELITKLQHIKTTEAIKQ
jgi:hypothetical protein